MVMRGKTLFTNYYLGYRSVSNDVDHQSARRYLGEAILKIDEGTMLWLLNGDPAVRWQVERDLLDKPPEEFEATRSLVSTQGWGAKLLALQDDTGMWGGGLYSPKWISSHYTLFALLFIGLPPGDPQALKAANLLLNKGYYKDGGINFSRSIEHSETCITGMVLSMLAYFDYPDERIHDLADHLVGQQMPDGGWNCQSYRGARHSSFHTTISVLEGLFYYAERFPDQLAGLYSVRQKAHEFLFLHQLCCSHRTGELVHPTMARFPYPPRWQYDVLRALDYFQMAKAEQDERFGYAVALIEKKRRPNGRWQQYRGPSGRIYFNLEKAGVPGRWNTLRALRVLRWWRDE
jgi:hypothetical protein